MTPPTPTPTLTTTKTDVDADEVEVAVAAEVADVDVVDNSRKSSLTLTKSLRLQRARRAMRTSRDNVTKKPSRQTRTNTVRTAKSNQAYRQGSGFTSGMTHASTAS